MANIVVFVELRGGAPTGPSLAALAEARRLGDGLGATIYALLGAGEAPDETIDGWAAALGTRGADKVLVCVDASLAGGLIDPTWGPLLRSVCDKLRPRLFLLPAGRAGDELGPPLAVRLGAAYAPRVSLDLTASAEAPLALKLRRLRGRAGGAREVDFADVDKPVVATLPAASGAPASGRRGLAVEAELVALPAERPPALEILAATPDEEAERAAACELAAGIVVVAPALAGAAGLREALEIEGAPGARVAVVAGDAHAAARLEAASPAVIACAGVIDPLAAAALSPSPDAFVAWSGGKAPPKGTALPFTAVWASSLDEPAAALGRAVAAARGDDP